MKKSKFAIDLNSPVILWMTGLSLGVLIIDMTTGGFMVRVFAAYRTSLADPLQYVRVFSHVLVHANMAHYVGNFMMMLAIGPMVEEKYGSRNLCWFVVITALLTGLINVVFFPGKAVVGASGIVFMLILLASFTNIRQGRVPITVLLVAVLYIGNEIILGLFNDDNISRISHITGGLCGAVGGAVFHARKHKPG